MMLRTSNQLSNIHLKVNRAISSSAAFSKTVNPFRVFPEGTIIESAPKKKLTTGRWEQFERHAFLRGLRQHGKGKWKAIGNFVPTRTTIQVKTHAQMVIRRIESGENVFTDLDEPLEKPEATTTVFSQRHVLKPIDANVPVKRKIAKKTVKPVKFGIATAKISPKQNPTFFVRPLPADYVRLDEHVTEKRDIDAALILRSLRTANNSDQV